MFLTMKCFLFTLLLLSCINTTTESINNSPVIINNTTETMTETTTEIINNSTVIFNNSTVIINPRTEIANNTTNICNPPHSDGNEILKIIEIASGILIAVIGLFTAYHLPCRRKLIRSLCLDGQNDGDDDHQSGVELERLLNAPPAQQSMDRVGSSSGNREESNTVGNGGSKSDIENGIRNAMLLKWLLSFPRLAGGFYFHINKVNPYSASVSDDDKKKMGKKSNKRHKPKTSDDEDGDDKKKEEGKKRSDKSAIDGNSGSMNDNENIVRNEMGLERMLRPKEDDVKQKSVPASNLPEEYRNDGSSDDDDGSQRIKKRSKKKWYSSEEEDDSDSYSDNGTDDDTRKGKESKKRHKSKKSRGRGKSKRRVYSSDESDDDDDKKKKKGKERLDKSDIDGNTGSMNDNEEDVKTKSVPASSLPEEPPAGEIKKVNPYSDSVSDDDTREGKESKKRDKPKTSDDEDEDDTKKKGKKRSDKSDIDEYAFAAGVTSIGVRGKDSVCVVTLKKVSGDLLDPTAVTHLFKVTKFLGLLVTDTTADARQLVQQARNVAAEFHFNNGFEMPVDALARWIESTSQVGLVAMVLGIDDGNGPKLFKCDPAGHFFDHKATSAGWKEQKAINLLEEMKNDPEFSYDETVQTAIFALQFVLEKMDFKANEIEVVVVRKENPAFHVLSTEEIDEHLTAISDRYARDMAMTCRDLFEMSFRSE